MHYGPTGERRGNQLTIFVCSFAPPPRMVIFCLIDFAVEAQVRASVARRSRDRGGRGSWPDMNSLPATGAWKPARMAPSPRMAWRRPSGRCLGDLQVQLCPHHRASRQH